MIITTSSEHDFITGERVHFAGGIYWAKSLDPLRVELYENSSLTAVAASIEEIDYSSSTLALSLITPLDRAPNITIYPRSGYTDDGRGILGAYVYETSLTTSLQNYNLKTAALASGWDGKQILYAVVHVSANVIIGSVSPGLYYVGPYENTIYLTTRYRAFTIEGLPTSSRVTIYNNGYIVGAGGRGSNGSAAYEGAEADGYPGGDALFVSGVTTVIHNYGIIGGGGGGGSGGDNNGNNSQAGGGGAGNTVGGAGPGGWGGVNPQPGTLLTGGTGRFGGYGGNLGFPGDNYGLGGIGGAAGYAITGSSNVIYAVQGDIRGPII